jgi:hypothetical protein
MELRIMFTYGDGEERSVVSGLRRKESESERDRGLTHLDSVVTQLTPPTIYLDIS